MSITKAISNYLKRVEKGNVPLEPKGQIRIRNIKVLHKTVYAGMVAAINLYPQSSFEADYPTYERFLTGDLLFVKGMKEIYTHLSNNKRSITTDSKIIDLTCSNLCESSVPTERLLNTLPLEIRKSLVSATTEGEMEFKDEQMVREYGEEIMKGDGVFVTTFFAYAKITNTLIRLGLNTPVFNTNDSPAISTLEALCANKKRTKSGGILIDTSKKEVKKQIEELVAKTVASKYSYALKINVEVTF